MSRYALIMAGGEGTRLWPLSRRASPKQALRLLGERTMFQMAVDRLLPMVPTDRIMVVTAASQVDTLRDQVPSLPSVNFVAEPSQKGTASVIGLGAMLLQRRDPQATMACLTADHFIRDQDAFLSLLGAAFELAERDELVTLGITPTYPATGFGYIRLGSLLGEIGGRPAFRVDSFTEKPDRDTAADYVESGAYVWNSGMFVWRAERILSEIARLEPGLRDCLSKIETGLGTVGLDAALQSAWPALVRKTIDYAIMERASQTAVLRADDLGWWDLGGWQNLFEILDPDAEGNIILAGKGPRIGTVRSLVFQDESLRADRLVATLGVEDLVIVDTRDVLLVCRRDQAERVREIVQWLAELGEERYL